MDIQISNKEIVERLIKLQAQVNKLQEDFEDSQLSEEDLEALRKAEEEYKRGELVSLEDIESLREKNVSD